MKTKVVVDPINRFVIHCSKLCYYMPYRYFILLGVHANIAMKTTIATVIASYDCAAESAAQQHASTCKRKVLPDSGRPGYKENIYRFRNTAASREGAADAAMAEWWDELSRNGMRSDMLFDKATRTRTNGTVTRFTKMAWWSNKSLGCAIQQCRKFYSVVCMYSPGGNNVDNRVYNVGAVCSGCAAVCVNGLCPAP
ncbi:unnamed protein product [Heligmosomoides polygyrus]|uniref:SCP domain-containing protein n=1 Tax=Heligmosomoides polygyrus TaxID=6339 RepID=A0A183F3L5_HELPZ|nr:unnamed protein product [Heligmosomoides polygyrus]